MSMNLYLSYSNSFPVQTPTSVSYAAYEAGGTGTGLEADLRVLRYVRDWYLNAYGLLPLQGKDARNPFLISQRDAERERIEDTFRGVERELRGLAPYGDRKIRVG